MADSTVTEISKMKVVDLRKELKSRGLSCAGDKAELVARLQAAMSQDDHGDITLDSDEIDSDGVLEDEDDKSQTDILDDTAVDSINEDLALAEQLPPQKSLEETKPTKTLKRKITTEVQEKGAQKECASKKIVLNRATSVTSTPAVTVASEAENISAEAKPSDNKIKLTGDIDPKTRLEMRAKRFGLPIKMSDNERKEARKQRFNQNSASTDIKPHNTGTLTENVEKLKKRAERFGQSVSKIMTDIEKKEKLEQRKAKFGTVN